MSSFAKRTSRMLHNQKARRRILTAFSCLSVLVALVVARALTFRANSLTATVEAAVLDCKFEGEAAHTHTADCYDAEGELVCPLEERELHTHTADCYNKKGKLVCGKEELTEEHVHDEDCFVAMADANDAGVSATGSASAGQDAGAQGDEPGQAADEADGADGAEDTDSDEPENARGGLTSRKTP